jgi:hypothetical protein
MNEGCCWTDCSNEAVTMLEMDAGQTTCQTCGAVKTNKTGYPLCQEHIDLYRENPDNALVMANATPGGMS